MENLQSAAWVVAIIAITFVISENRGAVFDDVGNDGVGRWVQDLHDVSPSMAGAGQEIVEDRRIVDE
jgi:hypothetical protein